VYQQHQQHLINKLNVLTCPREWFCKDLLRQMKQWRAAGKRLVLCLLANKNIYRAELYRQLTDLHGLGMVEVVGEFTGKRLGATFFRGSEPIDVIWATSDLEVAHAYVMPVGYGIGDHHLFVVDFSNASMISTCPPKIVRPALRRLNTKIPGCSLRYNWALQKNILRHQLLECMINVAKSHKSKETILAQHNQLDREGEQYMKHAEKKCCRIKSGCIPFSPDASLWIHQCQVYRSLFRWHAGKIRNWGNLKRTTRRCRIEAPFFLSVEELKLRLEICKQKRNYFRKHGKRHRQQYLNQCLEAVKDRADYEAEQKILAIIRQEKVCSFWRRLNFALGKHIRGQSIREV
jgi:hypothetical protein